MNFTQMVNKVADRHNLTSSDALTRIGDSINEAYAIVSRRCGMTLIGRADVTVVTTPGNRDLVVGPNVDKVITVFNPAVSPVVFLDEIDYDILKVAVPGSDPASQYAVKEMGANTVTLFLGSTTTTAYPLTCSCRINVSVLSGTMVPRFDQNFHDLLVNYAAAIELRKKEKAALAKEQDDKFEKRLGELVYFNTISAWKDIYQGAAADVVGTTTIALE